MNGLLRTFSLRKVWLCVCLFLMTSNSFGQYRTDKVIGAGYNSLEGQEYVLAIKYFNWAISAKPYLYGPWFYRAEAKYFLDDFVGAESDVTQALELNPYIGGFYELRALTRFKLQNFEESLGDWIKALQYNPSSKKYNFNRALCEFNLHRYDEAESHLKDIINRWEDFSDAFSLLGEVKLNKKDTIQAEKYVEQSLKLNPYNADNWKVMAGISYNRKEWKKVDESTSKIISFDSRNSKAFLMRAISRYYLNRLRESLEDYDQALRIDPDNFRGHFNRGKLRQELGDDNRAIQDFDYLVAKDPKNWLFLLNRADLSEKVADYKSAIRDFSALIKIFPNFWYGLQHRASCYRKLGMKNKAELDEFKIVKAQMDKRFGIQPRWSAKRKREVIKMRDMSFDKYDSFVDVEEKDSASQVSDRRPLTGYKGRVQDYMVEIECRPMYELSYYNDFEEIKSTLAYLPELDSLNRQKKYMPLYVVCNKKHLDDENSMKLFSFVDKISADLSVVKTNDLRKVLLLRRGIAYTLLHDYDSALDDFNEYVSIDDKNPLVYWQKAICEAGKDGLSVQGGIGSSTGNSAEADLSEAIKLNNKNAYIYYNRGNLYYKRMQYQKAIDDYTKAIEINPGLAEAYFNRGIVRLKANGKSGIVEDLSKAGELGIIDAYSIIKQIRSSKKK